MVTSWIKGDRMLCMSFKKSKITVLKQSVRQWQGDEKSCVCHSKKVR